MSDTLPAWAHTIRPAQQEAVDAIVRRFESGATVVLLDAPTGSGKTLVAELVRRTLGMRGVYVCSDRGLQDQVLRDFDYAKVIKGRRNYPTQARPQAFPELTCDDCTGTADRRCDWCDPRGACPYLVAKRDALGAALACANTSYYLAEANGPGSFSDDDSAAPPRLVIVDEADKLEGLLQSAVSVTIGARRLHELTLAAPPPESTAVQLVTWLQDHVLPPLEQELARGEPDAGNVRAWRRYKATKHLAARVEDMIENLPLGNWVYVPERKADGLQVVFKPVLVGDIARVALWPHTTRWLLMSATIMNAAGMARDLGLQDYAQWAVVRMPSTFPVERRPVYAMDTANVTARSEDAAVPHLVRELRRIMAEHPTDRMLVHTVSLRLMTKLQTFLRDHPRTLWYAGADTRADVVQQYLLAPGAVLFAPALERGLDLPDDACRVVVVAKVPYPDLGDKQVATRLQLPGGQDWYRDQTLRSLVQMTGRGMRHADDWCSSYILDAQFSQVLQRYQGFLPKWWLEAVVQ